MGHIYSVDSSPRKKLIRSFVTSAALSLLFVVVYSGCNWLTAQRSDVGTLAFSWEQYIPFISVFIIPYMSIDLFFLGAPFICADREERRILAKRITFAILVAGAFFLIMPFHFAFNRPVPDDWTGPIYSFLHAFDQPYNLFPSLHIALRTILADTYARHTNGVLRWLVHIWFSLIGFSTLFTYQHHVMDVVGGFILGGFCFYLFRKGTEQEKTTNRRIGLYYASGAGLSLLFAVIFWPLGGLLLWPAVSFLLVALAYFGLIANVYRKENSKLPLVSKLLLAPSLLGQQLSLQYYKSHAKPWDVVERGLWLGRKLNDVEAEAAVRQGVTAVLDVTGEFTQAKPFLALRHMNIPILDLTAPTWEQMNKSAAFIGREKENGTVYVHCKIGFSRSAVMVGAYLLVSGAVKNAGEAIELMRSARPSLIVRPEAERALAQFEQRRREDVERGSGG